MSPRNSFNRSDEQRVVVTGMGAITPVGHTVPETWEALKAGRSGLGRITSLDPEPWPCQVAGEVKEFKPELYIPRKKLRHMAVSRQLAVVAAGEALEDAALNMDLEDHEMVGVVLGTAGSSTIGETEQATMEMIHKKNYKASPFQVLRVWPNMAAFFVAETYRLRGHNSTVCTACASSNQAIGEAADVIRSGKAEVILAGGAECLVSHTVLAGFIAMRALATSYNDEPHRAMRPFDANREGFVAAIGSAILVLESLAHAKERDARIYAEVLGYGASNDIYHMAAPDPEGKGAAFAIRQALAAAQIQPEDVDYINSHATSTLLGDKAETYAIKRAFGKQAYEIPINATKSMIGHMMGAAGALEAIACVMSIQEGIIHPTINYETPDPECDLDYVPNVARNVDVKVAVSNSFGMGGQNAVLVLAAPDFSG